MKHVFRSTWKSTIPKPLWSDFLAYQYKQNKLQLLAILPFGILFYVFYHFPTGKFATDIVTTDFYTRLFFLATFLPLSLYHFFKQKNLHANDILINFFSVTSCGIWLYLLDKSQTFDTPSFMLSTSVFIFTCCAVTKTRLIYALFSTIIITLMTIIAMLRQYDEIIYTLYQSVFLYLPIVAFALIFCWQNLYIAKRQFLRKMAYKQEKRQLVEEKKDLSHQAYSDKLTGIRNRRCFEKDFHLFLQEIPSSARLSAMIVDLDFFKKYNDNYGHLKGDDCLLQVAQCMRNQLRALTNRKTKVYRVGGEEFFIIHQHSYDAEELAQALVNAIEKLNIEHLYRGDSTKCITASIGGCYFDAAKHGKLTDVIHEADKNLYRAKQYGKNQIFFS